MAMKMMDLGEEYLYEKLWKKVMMLCLCLMFLPGGGGGGGVATSNVGSRRERITLRWPCVILIGYIHDVGKLR